MTQPQRQDEGIFSSEAVARQRVLVKVSERNFVAPLVGGKDWVGCLFVVEVVWGGVGWGSFPLVEWWGNRTVPE